MEKVLCVCKHNVFRSRVAEEFLNKYGNGKVKAGSAGIISWDKDRLEVDEVHLLQKKIAKTFGIDLTCRSKSLSFKDLKSVDTIIIVADNVHPSIFNGESFYGKLIVWNVKDVDGCQNIEETIRSIIEEIQLKVKDYLVSLKKG